MYPQGVVTHNCASISSGLHANLFAVIGLMKECVAPELNKTLVKRWLTSKVPITTAWGSFDSFLSLFGSFSSSTFGQNTLPLVYGFFKFQVACVGGVVVAVHPRKNVGLLPGPGPCTLAFLFHFAL